MYIRSKEDTQNTCIYTEMARVIMEKVERVEGSGGPKKSGGQRGWVLTS
jgi:hypothetical protein